METVQLPSSFNNGIIKIFKPSHLDVQEGRFIG